MRIPMTPTQLRDWAAAVWHAYDSGMQRGLAAGGWDPEFVMDCIARKMVESRPPAARGACAQDTARRTARACVASALLARELGADPADVIDPERFFW